MPPVPPPAAARLDGTELVVFGGGLLGAAVARVATAAGARVTVASRTPRAHAGMWRAVRVVKGTPFPAWIPRDARVVVALAPGPGERPESAWGPDTEKLVRALARGGRPVVVSGPLAPAPAFDTLAGDDVTVVRFAPLFGVGDRSTAPLVRALRDRGAGQTPRRPPTVPLLWADDAARALLALDGGRHRFAGPERIDATALSAALVARYGGEVTPSAWGRAGWDADALALAAATPDDADPWDDTRFGPRTTLLAWAERLPGPRRRR